MESEAALACKLMAVIELARKVEVLKNILYYSNHSEFERIARHRSSFNAGHFLVRFKDVSTPQLVRIAFAQLFEGSPEVTRGQFLLSLRPEVLQNKQIIKQHNVTQDYSKIISLLVLTVCQKAVARDDLSAYVKSNFDWFRETLKIFAGRIEMRHFLMILKQQNLTAFQMELFMNEFFKKQETISVTEFCGIGFYTSGTISEDSKISLPMSTLSCCDSLILPIPYIYECFANYISTMASFEEKISYQTELFNEVYNESTFHKKLMALYRRGLQKMNPRFNNQFFHTETYRVYEEKKKDFDLKELEYLVKEMKLPEVSDRSVKVFFGQYQSDGLISVRAFYNLLNDNRLCDSAQQQIPPNDTSLQELLTSHLILASNLESIKSLIWLSQRSQLFELFNAIDVDQEGELSIEAIEEFFRSSEFKKKPGEVYEAVSRLFGQGKISLRNFILQFATVS